MAPRMLLLAGVFLAAGCAATSSSTALSLDHPASVDVGAGGLGMECGRTAA